MSMVYAVTVGFICDDGRFVKNSYTVADAPFNDEQSAAKKADKVLKELEKSYKCLESETDKIAVKVIDDTVKMIVKITNDIITPLVQCSVLAVDMSADMTVPTTTLVCGRKHGTEEQTTKSKQMKQINRYIATNPLMGKICRCEQEGTGVVYE